LLAKTYGNDSTINHC